MTTINSATSSGTTSGIASTATQPGIGEEFNSFIQLLTAQVRNQDPLSPMDSTQFVEQLATFSTLEQQVHA
ncbi:MAG: flagellar hook capping FlgD N-terminal domain-containing protein [Hyphomonas sp.]